MLFAKDASNQGGKAKLPITAENVVSVCPQCGKDVQVNLSKTVKCATCSEFDLLSADFLCNDCLLESEKQEPEDEDEPSVDELLADGKYAQVATEAAYAGFHADKAMNAVFWRLHRVEKLTGLGCPDIITTNEARMAREKIGILQSVLDEADETLRKLQLKTDHRSAEERLLDAVFDKETEVGQ